MSKYQDRQQARELAREIQGEINTATLNIQDLQKETEKLKDRKTTLQIERKCTFADLGFIRLDRNVRSKLRFNLENYSNHKDTINKHESLSNEFNNALTALFKFYGAEEFMTLSRTIARECPEVLNSSNFSLHSYSNPDS